MKLSDHFTLEEFIFSQTAIRHGIDNTPDKVVLARLKNTAAHMEIVREILGGPIRVSSAFRAPRLNVAVGGSKTSDHCKGDAIDFTCASFGNPYRVARELSRHKARLGYDQLIHEYGSWVHISFGPRRRNQDLSIFSGTGYLPGIVQKP